MIPTQARSHVPDGGPAARPYEVLGRIGAGGMGEVYRARDTRLDRTVALKVLPSEVSGDGALRSRFEREAKTISALAHPHIWLEEMKARVSGDASR